jgi:hypothetical protein
MTGSLERHQIQILPTVTMCVHFFTDFQLARAIYFEQSARGNRLVSATWLARIIIFNPSCLLAYLDALSCWSLKRRWGQYIRQRGMQKEKGPAGTSTTPPKSSGFLPQFYLSRWVWMSHCAVLEGLGKYKTSSKYILVGISIFFSEPAVEVLGQIPIICTAKNIRRWAVAEPEFCSWVFPLFF